jgi:riboflavin kinase/FMN adenylyltransferase
VRYNDREISSTYVREAVAGGDIQLANTLLGRKYFFEGIVVAGNQIGRTLDFPTVNLIPEEEKVLPVFGVYASSVCMEGITYTGVTNIGVKPTIGSTQPCVETYLLDYEGNAYGKKIRVSLEYFVRPEMRFDSLAQLKEQVHKDICNVRTNHPQSII